MHKFRQLLQWLFWMAVISIFTFNKLASASSHIRSGKQFCTVPETPDGGKYVNFKGWPGDQIAVDLEMEVICKENYTLVGSKLMKCSFDGRWDNQPECKRKCQLLKSRTIEVKCIFNDEEVDCSELQNHGTTVISKCKPGHYNSNLVTNKCIDGGWRYHMPSCSPSCGELPGVGVGLVVNGTVAPRGLFPWHAVVYKIGGEDPTGYIQICGGTIVSNYFVISAAHCFYNDNLKKLHPAEMYLVGLGKSTRTAGDENDNPNIQNSDIKNIIVPLAYRGDSRNHQSDIAMLELESEIEFTQFVHPICLSYDKSAEKSFYSQRESRARVPGMGLTSDGGRSSEKLMYVDLPVIDGYRCTEEMPESFQKYLTNDKICAGYLNGTGVCNGDSGGGLVFKSNVHNVYKWYLLGIVSIGVPSDTYGPSSCKRNTYATFTQVSNYTGWIQETVDQLVVPERSEAYSRSLLPPHCVSNDPDEQMVDASSTPWLVVIVDRFVGTLMMGCNGALISKRYVLTAGGCVRQRKYFTNEYVKLGNVDGFIHPLSDPHPAGSVRILIEQIILPTKYDKNNVLRYIDDSIGLIRLKEDAPITDIIRPVCLPSSGNIPPSVASGVNLFGERHSGEVLIDDACPHDVPKEKLCVISGFCSITQGAPMVGVVEGRRTLIGVAASALDCGRPKVFARVSPHSGWIKAQMRA